MTTQTITINGMSMIIPSYYLKVDSMPGDPENSLPFMARTETTESFVIMHPILAEKSKPRNKNDFIKGVRQFLQDNQGLIQIEAEDTYLFSIVKTLKDPSGVQYILTFQKFMKEGILQIQGFFDETGVTGMRDSIVFSILTKNGEIGMPGDPMKGWKRDPYDLTIKKGALMNLSEEDRFDEMFPGTPLTMCRELVKCLMETDDACKR